MDLEIFSKTVRVLVVDDDEEDFFILKKIFQKIPNSPFKLEWAATFDKGLKLVNERRHEVFLIDYQLGEHTGLELLRRAKAEERSEPFILLTGMDDREIEWQSMSMAAADYLIKGKITSEVLSRAIYYSLQRKQIEKQRLQHLVELNRSKDEFISIASHQLRTPATAVKQYLGMVLEGFVGEVEPRQHALLTKAYENNERQLGIVSDLLRVAQVDAGQVMLRKEEVAINGMLETIIHNLAAIFKQRDQTVVFYPAASQPHVIVDASSIQMVFENLLDNASKYSEEGTQVTVTITSDSKAVTVQIADEGVGIREEDRSRLFEKFSRFDNLLSTKVGGTGLGLYWAKKIVTLHDGTIVYEPNMPQGSIFRVDIPK